MNNVIFILVDSVFSECIGTRRTKLSSTPFIDKLITEGVFAPSVYSYGPYTDAATRGLYCGNRTLDDYGYFFGLNSSSENHFKTFKDNNYETIGLYYPYYLIGSKIEQNIDHSIFIGGFVYKSEWGGKFNYYADKKKTESLSEQEYLLLEKHVDLMFDCWFNFYRILDSDPQSGSIVNGLADDNEKKQCRDKLAGEYAHYLKNKTEYIDGILSAGLNHSLSEVDEYNYDNAIDTQFLHEKVYGENKKFFSKLAKVEFTRNLKNNKINFIHALKAKRCLANWVLTLGASKYSRYLSGKPGWQYSASMYKQVNAAVDAIKSRSDKQKPFYLSLHTEEPHNYIAFFSYDVQDERVIKEELDYLEPLVNECGKEFSGSLTYQLSLRYVDLNIQRLFEKLQQIGELEKTTILITADHGSSYTFNPIRDVVVNNFYKESYKTPLLIWKKNMGQEKGVYNGLYSAEDTLPTLLKIANLNVPEQYKGLPIISNKRGRDYVITEYMGPGVPDMITRAVWISIRNKHYMIAFKNPINKEFNLKYCVEAYDLLKDEKELNNINESMDFSDEEVSNLIEAVKCRFKEIQENTSAYLQALHDKRFIK